MPMRAREEERMPTTSMAWGERKRLITGRRRKEMRLPTWLADINLPIASMVISLAALISSESPPKSDDEKARTTTITKRRYLKRIIDHTTEGAAMTDSFNKYPLRATMGQHYTTLPRSNR